MTTKFWASIVVGVFIALAWMVSRSSETPLPFGEFMLVYSIAAACARVLLWDEE